MTLLDYKQFKFGFLYSLSNFDHVKSIVSMGISKTIEIKLRDVLRDKTVIIGNINERLYNAGEIKMDIIEFINRSNQHLK